MTDKKTVDIRSRLKNNSKIMDALQEKRKQAKIQENEAIIELFQDFRMIFIVLDQREGHIRLQCHQPAVHIRKRDHGIRNKEILVPAVKIIFFKLAHPVTLIPSAAVKRAQGKHDLFGFIQHFQIELHFSSPFSSSRSRIRLYPPLP